MINLFRNSPCNVCNRNPCSSSSCGSNRSGCGCGSCKKTCCCPYRNQYVEYEICYRTRFVDVPMSIYYGRGFTEVDCCEETLSVLKDISNTLKRCCGIKEPRCPYCPYNNCGKPRNCGCIGCGNNCCK